MDANNSKLGRQMKPKTLNFDAKMLQTNYIRFGERIVNHSDSERCRGSFFCAAYVFFDVVLKKQHLLGLVR